MCSSSCSFLASLSFAGEGRKTVLGLWKKEEKRGFPAAAFYDRLDKITSPLITLYANNDEEDGAEMSC